jgi:metal iron transporter
LYRPDGKLNILRAFEYFIGAIVLGVFICFCIELSDISAPVGEVFKGFLPSKTVFVSAGLVPNRPFCIHSALIRLNSLYESCAILGGTLMPHSIYLGSGIVQARLRDFDIKADIYHEPTRDSESIEELKYRPSLRAIRSCMSYTISELCITLFVVAVFVNSAILIVAAASLSEDADDADLFGMYDLFRSSISQAAATILAVALLFSGTSTGVLATLAGQLVMEGAMHLRINPFVRRLVTRLIAVIPGMIIAAAEGRNGLAAALNGCNVVLSLALIFLTAPLLWYTSREKYMTVLAGDEHDATLTVHQDVASRGDTEQLAATSVSMANSRTNTVVAFLVWVLIAFLNVALLVLLGLGLGDD